MFFHQAYDDADQENSAPPSAHESLGCQKPHAKVAQPLLHVDSSEAKHNMIKSASVAVPSISMAPREDLQQALGHVEAAEGVRGGHEVASSECWMSRGLGRGRCSMVIPVSKVGKGLLSSRGGAKGRGGGGGGTGGGKASEAAATGFGRGKKGSTTAADARAEELRAMMAELASHFQEVSYL